MGRASVWVAGSRVRACIVKVYVPRLFARPAEQIVDWGFVPCGVLGPSQLGPVFAGQRCATTGVIAAVIVRVEFALVILRAVRWGFLSYAISTVFCEAHGTPVHMCDGQYRSRPLPRLW